ncbi:ankyrin-1-like [Homalodisca vitripennis]|nr:ankyrin-1-like [Homalodisca vitripennis]
MLFNPLIEKGANVNYIPSCGRSPLSTAAALGNIYLIQVLLNADKLNAEFDDDKENRNDHLQYYDNRLSNNRRKQNLGYYIFVHDEVVGAEDLNRNESLDAETPEGMEGLEWDTEVEVEGVCEEETDDVWSCQYRWYADILDRTGGLVVDTKQECDINLQDCTGRCAVHYAVENSQLEALQCLIAAGCKVNVGDVDNLTPLHLAAMKDHYNIAELLVDRGANVNQKTTDKMAPLHYAAVRGFSEIVELLLRHGAMVDPLDANDRTPLMLAVIRDHIDVVQLLVRHGAKVNIEEIHGYTPLCEAVWNKSVEMATLLLHAGAKQTQSQNLLHYAVLHRHIAMAELLLRHGAYPNLRDDQGDTPLLRAITCCHLDMVRLLLRYEANPNFANSVSGITPLHQALKVDNRETIFEDLLELLCRYNVDLNMRSGCKMVTPLSEALCNGDLICAAALVRAGADVNINCEPPSLWPDPCPDNLMMAKNVSNRLVYLIVAAGFDLTHHPLPSQVGSNELKVDTEIDEWLKYMKFNPRRLTDLCRLKIRSQMGNRALQVIPSLQIPQSLKQFLLYRDIVMEKYTKPRT